ncbi:ParB/RepB/Spo0J family partition protein [Streptomyces sp. NPDC051907]|uniref:ParB/RepB/Spo0J family partition protein n=1 Tax=Streptomyces sp. NPDC051907 TaxID=3155284 RepID=UPI003441A2F2
MTPKTTDGDADPRLDSLLQKLERVPIGELKQFPGNPNEGNVEEIARSLKNNGLFEPIIVQKSTGYILSHNHVTQAADSLGWSHLDVIRVDVDDMAAKRIVAAANRTAELSRRNDFLLAELLSDIADGEHGLDGTGYDEGYLDELMDRVEPELPDAGEEPDEDGGQVIPAGPSGAHYAETEEQESSRGARVAGEQSLAAKGLAEMVVVMDVAAKSQLLLDIEAMRDHLGDQPTGPLLSAAVRIANVVLEAAKTNAPPVDWDKLLGQAAVRVGEPVA